MEFIISERLLEIRKEHGLTQAQFGSLLSVSQDTVSLWETGKSLPSAEYLVAIAQQFHVSADFILGLKEFD